MIATVSLFIINILERGHCFDGKCYCIPGYEGELCSVQTQPHSIVECASQCIDVCLKKCFDQQILCYTKCSDECNLNCLEKPESTTTSNNKPKIKSNA